MHSRFVVSFIFFGNFVSVPYNFRYHRAFLKTKDCIIFKNEQITRIYITFLHEKNQTDSENYGQTIHIEWHFLCRFDDDCNWHRKL